MSQILFYSLGGLQEDGKNLYVIEVDKKIFILDAGSKMPSMEMHGVDMIVPDISHLIENKNRVVGVFLTHAHAEHIGSVYQILEKIQTKVYGSRFTIAVLEDKLKHDGVKYNADDLVIVKSRSSLSFDDIKVRFFELAHNIPDCLGIDILTSDGNIVYTGNYNFDQNANVDYASMLRNLTVFYKERVLALLTDSLGAINTQNRGTILEFKTRMNNILAKATGRVIYSLYSDDILRIQQIVNIAADHNKKIAIIGKKTQRLLNQAIELGYLTIPEKLNVNLKYIDDANSNNDKNMVVLVTGERHEPFFMLQRMAKKIDRLIRLEKTDTIVVLTPALVGTEKMEARTLDIVYRVTSNVYTFKKDLLPPANAAREEIKMMINILKPRYVIPVIGEYRHQYACNVVANCVGIPEKHVLIVDQGNVCEFQNGKYVGITDTVKTGDILLDGKAIGNVGDVVMKDRELLAEDGVVIISANINPKNKRIVVGPEIVSKGFIYDNDTTKMLEKVKQAFFIISERFLNQKFINWSEYKTALKSEISTLIYKTIKRHPIIIPVLISTDLEYNQEIKIKVVEKKNESAQG